ncbi:MAG: hypothetical protein JWS10_3496 [Cypionkella sp.]|nr:hypothetical protein [Cypionkella sp.]
MPGKSFVWDRYHIENYLLEEHFIRKVMIELRVPGAYKLTDADVLERLQKSAEITMSKLIQHEIENFVSKLMVKAINVGTRRDIQFSPSEVFDAVIESQNTISDLIASKLTSDAIHSLTDNARTNRRLTLQNGKWKSDFRGRDVLRQFVNDEMCQKTDYEGLRNLILARMRDAHFEPEGMRKILAEIDAL